MPSSCSKSLSQAIWLPQRCRARVLRARGNFMNTMGHTAPIDISQEGSSAPLKSEKAIELLPEEALYLIERGSMLCWTQLDRIGDDFAGTPMSVQQAYAHMIGQDKLTLEMFQVSLSSVLCLVRSG